MKVDKFIVLFVLVWVSAGLYSVVDYESINKNSRFLFLQVVSSEVQRIGELEIKKNSELFDFRESPFIPKFEKKEVKRVVTLKKPKIEVSRPNITLNAILWGDNPVAIFKMGTQSKALKSGQEGWNFKVLKISKDQVTILFENEKFVYKK